MQKLIVLSFVVLTSCTEANNDLGGFADAGHEEQGSLVDANAEMESRKHRDSAASADAADVVMVPEVSADDSSAPPSPSDASVTKSGTWLSTKANHIVKSDGTTWHGRGATVHDTRGCNACAYGPPNAGEVNRRIDELVDNWKANYVRLTLESYATAGGRTTWQSVLTDPYYLADLKKIVDHVGTKSGVYIMLSIWVDPSLDTMGWPTATTIKEWQLLADTFRNDPHVIFAVSNEPQMNYDGSLDAACWKRMNDTVAAIRAVEDGYGTPHHLVSVQGTGGWSRRLDYYVKNPITAGGGADVIYEVHVYDPTSTFADRFVNPAKTLPVIIGEFGPVAVSGATMSMTDCTNLMDQAEKAEVPYLAWTFHQRCPPNLLVDVSAGCGVGMTLTPTAWGTLLKTRLSKPW